MNKTMNNGSLTKSQEFDKSMGGNQTVIHESSNRPSSIGHDNGKQRHSSATYKRPTEEAHENGGDRG